MGFCGIFEHFPRFEFFLLPSIVHARPHAGEAGRYTDAEAQSVADTQISTHAADDDAHHARYTDAEAVAAVGAVSGLPTGCIVLWSGSIASIPSSWALCDGSSGTPDLRDKFIVGAKQDDSGTAKTNLTGSLTQSGGSIDHTHDDHSDLSHSSDGAHTHDDHTITSHSTATAPPPYYALAYIMKT